MAKKVTSTRFRLGTLTEDDLDQDYEAGRSEKTMTPAHKARLDALADELKAQVGKK